MVGMRLLSAILSLAAVAYAQTPSVTSAQPTTANAGGSGFQLTVNGSGFVSGSTVKWSGTPLATTYVSDSQLTATVTSNLIAICGRFPLTVLIHQRGVERHDFVRSEPRAERNLADHGGGSAGLRSRLGQGFEQWSSRSMPAARIPTSPRTMFRPRSCPVLCLPALTGVYPLALKVTDTSTAAAIVSNHDYVCAGVRSCR